MAEIDLFARRGMGGRHPSLADRIDVGDCWQWTGSKDGRGYGQVNMWPDGLKQAHRVIYEALVGSIPEGLELDHLCRNPPCVNPDHLEPVTHRENLQRGATGKISGAQQRAKTHCKWGHEFNESNTYVWVRDGKPKRECRACRRLATRRYQEAQIG